MIPAPSFKQQKLWLLLIVLTLAWFGTLHYRHLVKQDEGRYAEIAREMATSGDWTTPRLNDIKYFEKPPLQYWATAATFRAFGEREWGARLWSALTGFSGVLLIYFAGRRLFGPEAGFNAALVLASSALYALIGHINTLDMGVTFFMSLGLAGFLLAQQPSASGRATRVWMHVAWAALALAVLSKGLMGIVLPAAVLVMYTLIERDWALWRRLHLASGLALFLAICVPWFIAVSLANPEFPHFFFIHEHFERFLTKVHRRYEPWWYFGPILLGGILPWLAPMFDALARAWKADPATPKAFQPRRFLLLWCAVIFVFFSASGSKLASYILPIFPALALLIGQRLAQTDARTLFRQMLPVALLAATALALAPQVAHHDASGVTGALYANYAVWAVAAAAIWLCGTLAGLYMCHRERLRPALLAFAFSSFAAAQLALNGHESLAPSNSAYHIAQQIRPHLRPGIPFYSVGMYDQTLSFYLKRTFTLVAHQDELEFGLKQEPYKWIADWAAFRQTWVQQSYALAVMQPETHQRLQQEGLAMLVIAQDNRRVVVRTP